MAHNIADCGPWIVDAAMCAPGTWPHSDAPGRHRTRATTPRNAARGHHGGTPRESTSSPDIPSGNVLRGNVIMGAPWMRPAIGHRAATWEGARSDGIRAIVAGQRAKADILGVSRERVRPPELRDASRLGAYSGPNLGFGFLHDQGSDIFILREEAKCHEERPENYRDPGSCWGYVLMGYGRRGHTWWVSFPWWFILLMSPFIFVFYCYWLMFQILKVLVLLIIAVVHHHSNRPRRPHEEEPPWTWPDQDRDTHEAL
jgi:hypothetical protein